MKRKIFNVLTLMCMVITLMSSCITVFAEKNGTCGDNLTWTLDNNGTLTISGTGDMEDYSHSALVPWYSYSSSIKSVVIENGVTSIGVYAFSYCSSLTSVTIPDSVITMGSATFYDCRDLASIEIPNSVTTIGENAFDGTGYYNNDSNWEDDVLYIGNYLIEAKYEITSCNIKPGTKLIADGVFYSLYTLENIQIPDSVISIGKWAFFGCSGLENIKVSDKNANYLSDDYGVLYNKDKTELIQYSCGNTRTEFSIPDSVIKIEDGAFYGCNDLKTVIMGKGVKSIGYCSFDTCKSLTSVVIPNSLTSIGDCAFYDCDNLERVTIGEGVTSIGEYAFHNCINLKNVYYNGTEDDWNFG